jgi:flavin reductase (DIM6/NTAB) family NADH-FMN oxidoreductase RutF
MAIVEEAGAPREDMRQAMRRWSTGVAVVTLRAGEELRGVTVNSFTSVSLEPPLVMICLDRRARTHDLLLASRRYCINILAADQQVLSDRFAGRRPGEHGRFDDCSQRQSPAGLPMLDSCLAWLDCRLVDLHPAGDHTIFIGLVTHAEHADGTPLLYHGGQYRALTAPAL